MSDRFKIDSTKIMFHPQRVAQLIDARGEWEKAKNVFPIYVEISPAGSCNARCTFCAVSYIGYKTNFLDADMLDVRLQEMGALGVKSCMLAGEGEPTLHPRINDIARSAIKSGIDVAFTTNGVLLDRVDLTGVSWVKVSLNAGTRETYSKIHQVKAGDFDKAVRNLSEAVKRKGNCVIGAQMVLLPENQHEVETIKMLGADIGLDYVVIKSYSQHKMALDHTLKYEGFSPKIPTASDNLVVRSESMQTHAIPYDKCQATPYLWSYIMATGDVYSCSAYLLDDRFNLGNINTQTFKEIWHGEKRRANWVFVRNGLDIHDCRINCRMDKSNRYLDELINGVPHRNFI